MQPGSKTQIIQSFGTAVRRFRHRHGLSQEALAELAGLDRTYIGHVERGARNVSLSTIDKLARALQTSTAALLASGEQPGNTGSTSGPEWLRGSSVDILLVEGRRRDVESTLRAFKKAEITNPVQVVSDGAEALDFLFGQGRYASRAVADHPRLVLLDLNLPKLGGMEVLRRIKADPRTRHIPVVALTASRSDQAILQARGLGAAAYIVKPVDF